MEMPLEIHSHRCGASADDMVNEIRAEASNLEERPRTRAKISKRRIKSKRNTMISELATSASSSCCSETSSALPKGIKVKVSRNQARLFVGSSAKGRRRVSSSDYDALGLLLGMSIAAVISQVMEKSTSSGVKLSAYHLSEVCSVAVRESLENVFGDRFHSFARNFEKSLGITLSTLRLISDVSQSSGDQLCGAGLGACSSSLSGNVASDDAALKSIPFRGVMDGAELLNVRKLLDRMQQNLHEDCSSCPETLRFASHDVPSGSPSVDTNASQSFGNRTSDDAQECMHNQGTENSDMNQQLVVHDGHVQHLVCAYGSNRSSSMLSTMERSVFEQTRSNDLKEFEISLMMKKLNLQEKKMALKSDSNFLEKMKLSIGFSRASFKAEKFKTQLQEARQVELLKKCLDFLVSGLIIMLLSLAYGTYTYSYQRIIEASESCSPSKESKSRWSSWLPGSSFNSGFQLLRCQVQVFSRMLFGAIMISAIVFLLIQRSSASHQTMPITFILLLLGVACGYVGKFCVDTIGGGGYQWLFYWEALCLMHFFANVFHSMLFVILHGPITVAEREQNGPRVPYWARRFLFFAALVVLPLLCGLMPFASAGEWYDHFQSRAVDFVNSGDD